MYRSFAISPTRHAAQSQPPTDTSGSTSNNAYLPGIAVKPHPGPVTWARGQVPTPRGPLTVGWGVAPAGAGFVLVVTAPAGTTGDIAVPVNAARAQVRVNGRLAFNNGTSHAFGAEAADGYVILHNVPPGTHVITVVTVGR